MEETKQSETKRSKTKRCHRKQCNFPRSKRQHKLCSMCIFETRQINKYDRQQLVLNAFRAKNK